MGRKKTSSLGWVLKKKEGGGGGLVASSVFTNLNLKTSIASMRLTVYTYIWKNTLRPHGC